MKKIMLGLLFFSLSYAGKWVDKNGKPSKFCRTAGSKLGLEIPKDLKKAAELLNRYHIKDWNSLKEITSVLDFNGEKISEDKQKNFLSYNDEKEERSVVDIKDIVETTLVLASCGESDPKTDEYIADLLAPYIKLKNVPLIFIFAKHKGAQELAQLVFGEKLNEYKGKIKIQVASDQTRVAESCSQLLQKACQNMTGNYMAVTHWPNFVTRVTKNFTALKYIGSELQPLTWQKQLEMYGNGIEGCTKTLLHQIAGALYDEYRDRMAIENLQGLLKEANFKNKLKENKSSDDTGDSSGSGKE